jgi:hypothetical protein
MRIVVVAVQWQLLLDSLSIASSSEAETLEAKDAILAVQRQRAKSSFWPVYLVLWRAQQTITIFVEAAALAAALVSCEML